MTVPVSFVLGGDEGIDIQDLGPIEATSTFSNNSNTAVRIKRASCDASGLNSYFGVTDNNKAALSLAEGEISWVPSASKDQGIYVEETEDLREGFVMRAGDDYDCTLSLDMTGMSLKDTVIEATKSRSTLRDLMQMSWTFERALGSGSEDQDFYLKINSDASHEALAPYADFVYSLDEVAYMAEDISAKKEQSSYYPTFKAMAGDASKQYQCKTVWGDGGTYNLNVIGVLHDDLADDSGKAGITFQFNDVLVGDYRMNSANTTEGGWGRSEIRDRMNPGSNMDANGETTNTDMAESDLDDIWNLVPSDPECDLAGRIKQVKKAYGYHGIGSEVRFSNDFLFILSQAELTPTPYNISAYPWKPNEGSVYAYWQGKVPNNNSPNYSAASACTWRERTVHDTRFIGVGTDGDPSAVNGLFANQHFSGVWKKLGIRPAFCL